MNKKLIVLCILLVCCMVTIAPLQATSSSNAAQSSPLLKNVSAIYMKDNKKGWAILTDGSLILTKDSWADHKRLYTLPSYDKNISYPCISYINGTLTVYGYFTSKHETIDIYRSKNEGITWSIGHIKDPALKTNGTGNIYSSFVNEKNGYLLSCGGPGLGLMPKLLFHTADGGRTYKKVTDISYINGYPTGMVYNKDGTGFIPTTYHGNTDAYLYTSTDKGKTWKTLTVPSPKGLDYAYIEGLPPYFSGTNGFMILKYALNNNPIPDYIVFHSTDKGKTWSSMGCLSVSSTISAYCFSSKNTVYIIDSTGAMTKVKIK